MQLLGKNYFETENTENAVTETEEHFTEEGIDALSEVLEGDGHRRIPAWMAAAGNLVRENSRHLVVAASVLVIGFAVYVNWAMYNAPEDGVTAPGAGTVTASDGITVTDTDMSDPGVTPADDDYFAVSQINRQRARDEAIAVLQDVVDGAENLSDVQSDALAEIAQIAADIEHEAAIESLVKGKGFEACVAVISGDAANVIVKSSALLPNEVAQIQEIVYETSGIVPANVKIIEK